MFLKADIKQHNPIGRDDTGIAWIELQGTFKQVAGVDQVVVGPLGPGMKMQEAGGLKPHRGQLFAIDEGFLLLLVLLQADDLSKEKAGALWVQRFALVARLCRRHGTHPLQ